MSHYDTLDHAYEVLVTTTDPGLLIGTVDEVIGLVRDGAHGDGFTGVDRCLYGDIYDAMTVRTYDDWADPARRALRMGRHQIANLVFGLDGADEYDVHLASVHA